MEGILINKEDDDLREELERKSMPSEFIVNLMEIEKKFKLDKSELERKNFKPSPGIKKLKTENDEQQGKFFEEISNNKDMNNRIEEIYQEEEMIENEMSETCSRLNNLSIEMIKHEEINNYTVNEKENQKNIIKNNHSVISTEEIPFSKSQITLDRRKRDEFEKEKNDEKAHFKLKQSNLRNFFNEKK